MNALKNSVRLTGFLGGSPEVKTISDDKSLARVSIATHTRHRNSAGEWTTDTQWHNLVFWGKQATFAGQRLKKGSEIAVEGKLVNRQYVDKNGITRYVTEISVHEVLLLSRHPDE